MKGQLLILPFLLLFFVAKTQDIHIYYDVYKDSIYYMSNGEVIQKPLIKKGNDIILHVTNYNDYLYELEVVTEEEDYAKPSVGLGSMLPGGAGLSGFSQFQNLLAPIGDAEGTFDMGNLGENGPSGFGNSEESQVLTSQMKVLQENFKNTLAEIEDIRVDIQDSNQGLQTELDRQQYAVFMENEVLKLKTNADLPPATIKELTTEYLNKILNIRKDGNIDLDDLFDQANVRKTFGRKLQNYVSGVDNMNRKLADLNMISNELESLSYPLAYQAVVDTKVNSVEAETTQLKERAEQLETLIPSLEAQSIESLTALRYLHEEMKDHRFEKKIIISPESDITTLSITMKPIDSLSTQLPVRQLNELRVQSFGGLKVNASVGISFSSFFDRPQDYLVRDGLIYGDDQGAFLPVVTSFIHFYPESKKQTAIGGTLGIGLGLGGESSGLQNYFLGTSIIIGKEQRIVLSTGLMGGRVTRLAQGLSVGDTYNDLLIPTKNIYELGLFFGISFNVLGG